MRTRFLTDARYATLLSHISPSKPELSGYFDTERVFTRWMVDGEGTEALPYRFSRVAFDVRGPSGVTDDEHEVASVSYAREASAWRWSANGPYGVRTGYIEGPRVGFPLDALLQASWHLLGYQAHDRFCMGNISQSKWLVPSSVALRHPRRKQFLLPWSSYKPRGDAPTNTHEVYHRCWAYEMAPDMRPFFGEGRVGGVRAVRYVSRVGARLGASVYKGKTMSQKGWRWYVVPSRGGAFLEGDCKNRKDGFRKVEKALVQLGLDTVYVPPDVVEVRERCSSAVA